MDQILPFLPGMAMGFGMVYAKVHEPSIMVGQMTFSHFVLLKMFFAALAISTLVHGYYFQTRCISTEEREKYFQRNSRSISSVVIGTGLVGIGMTLSASCPGTLYAQLSSLSFSALFCLLGGLIGAFFFEFYQQAIFTFIDGKVSGSPAAVGTCAPQPDLQIIPTEHNALYKILNNQFYLQLTPELFCYYMGAILLSFVVLLEILVPWKSDLAMLYPNSWQNLAFPFDGAPPMIAGLFIGLGQFISLFYLGKQLGCSYTFVELAQIVYQHILQPNLSKIPFPIDNYIAPSIKTPTNKPFPITAFAIFFGGLLATLLTRTLSVGTSALDFPPIGRAGSGFFALIFLAFRLILGGFTIVVGARISAGCTSGYLSYSSSGSTTGYIGIAAMFGCAIITGILFKIF